MLFNTIYGIITTNTVLYIHLKGSKFMKCPLCGYTDSKVIDSRPTENGTIRRRRECLQCMKRFTTYEVIETIPTMVIKKDGSRQIFERNKLMSGIIKACYKRPVSMEEITEIVDDIESELQNSLSGDVKSERLGEMVMERLRDIDDVSYVRFASVYREFCDVETFMDELRKIKRRKRPRNKPGVTESAENTDEGKE